MSKQSFKEQRLQSGLKVLAAKTQKGVVLFFALIALVVMSLAAVALIRSVDTGVIVAGNLSFKQSATTVGDVGLASAMTWIENNGGSLTASAATSGYYDNSTSITTLTAATGATWPNGGAWTDATSRLATGSGISSSNPGFDQLTGNTIRYIIQRMCRTGGAATAANCLMGSAATGGNSLSDKSDPQLGALTNYSLSPMYRVTARVTGPKNTISYIQAYVF